MSRPSTEIKHAARSQFFCEIESVLSASPETNSAFSDPQLRVNGRNTHTEITRVIDFSAYETLLVKPDQLTIMYQSSPVRLSLAELAKYIVIKRCSRLHKHEWVSTNLAFLSLCCYLNERQIDQLKRSDLEDFFRMVLTHKPTGQGWVTRPQTTTYEMMLRVKRSLVYIIGEDKILSFGMVGEFFSGDVDRALSEAVLVTTGMTLADYEQHGTFNSLGLDTGKHYFDHCSESFYKYFRYSVAFRAVVDAFEDGSIKQACGLKYLSKDIGRGARTLMRGAEPRFHRIDLCRTWDIARPIVLTTFRDAFNASTPLSTAISLDCIAKLIDQLGLPPHRIDSEEFVRSFCVSLFDQAPIRPPESIFDAYRSTIESQGHSFNYAFDDFSNTCKAVVSDLHCQLSDDKETIDYISRVISLLDDPARMTIASLSKGKETANSRANDVNLALIRSFGVVSVMSLLGWRVSECSFPLSAIRAEPNTDLIDSSYCPVRYHVHWYVPKTHGGHLVNREITTEAYVLLKLLDALGAPSNGETATLTGLRIDTPYSTAVNTLGRFVKKPWPHFVGKYRLFVDSEGGTPITAADKELHEVRDNVRSNLFGWRLSNSDGFSPLFWITLYRSGDLAEHVREEIDTLINDDLLHYVSSDRELSKGEVSYISSQLLSDAHYPTPHALRHCWAEAVLRRYSGDVGRFIRANFKHLDNRFFMAYLRDKDMAKIYQMSTRPVISALVRKHIRSMSDEKREYAGNFDRFLDRVVRNTEVIDLELLAERIADERIIDIKANPFGFCFLRKGTEHAAKCSSHGQPQRHRASLRLCMDCINSEVQGNHFNWIVITLSNHLSALSDSKIPLNVRRTFLPEVISARKRVNELAVNSGKQKYADYVRKLDEVIEMVSLDCEVA